MYLRLIRNQSQGAAITGRLVINGRWFCNTLERVGYQIPALCYHIRVTQSPKFKRLLPLVCGVPQTEVKGERLKAKGAENGKADTLASRPSPLASSPMRSGIRFHRGTKPQHSTGCILVLGDNINDKNNFNPTTKTTISTTFRPNQLPRSARENDLSLERSLVVGSRTSAEVEQELTQLLLQTQNNHEEIILEVSDYRPGTEYGYNTPCPPELQKR